ncbi:uncharacterized protein IWZ02DRAFT_487451 [Phyllosticta citriasiana]|uniref:uncharacterized protein n=1 Tax=Phyllosticta citriasiana TaxID=595635 RepID=UPI0030FD6A14
MQQEDIESWTDSAPSSYLDHQRDCRAACLANGSLPHDDDSSLNAPDFRDPDDFYRQGPFFSPTCSPQSDKVVNGGAMATVSSRPNPPPHRVSHDAKPPSPALKSARQNLRSVSNPSSSIPVPNGSSAGTVSTNTHRPAVKNLVNKFNQPTTAANEGSGPSKLRKPAPTFRPTPRHASSPASTPSQTTASTHEKDVSHTSPVESSRDASNGSSSLNGGTNSRSTPKRDGKPESRHHTSESVSSIHSVSKFSGQPLLFGELPPHAQASESPGYGINAAARHRSGSWDGGAIGSGPRFLTAQDYTAYGSPESFKTAETTIQDRPASAQAHRKSKSDFSGLPLSLATEAQINANSIDQVDEQMSSSTEQIRSPTFSKIPLPTSRRTSLNSESNPSPLHSRANSRMSDRRYRPASPSLHKGAHGKENTPSSAQRHASAKRGSIDGPKVPVQVKVPPLPTSPVLRSSRPRQTVSAASTAASRAKVSEKSRIPSSSSGPAPKHAVASKTKIKDLAWSTTCTSCGGPSIADRRAAIEKSMRARGVKAQPPRAVSKTRVQVESRTVSPTSPAPDAQPQQIFEPEKAKEEAREDSAGSESRGRNSSLRTTDIPPLTEESEAPPTAVTEIENDESPVLGLLAPPLIPQPESKFEDTSTSESDSELLLNKPEPAQEHEVQAVASHGNDADDGTNILDSVMHLRQSRISNTPTEFTDENSSEQPNTGSIDIMLGPASSLEQTPPLWSIQGPTLGEHAIRWQGNELGNSRESLDDDRYSSVAPEDLTGVAVDSNNCDPSHDPRSADWTPHIHHPAENRFTLDSEGYTKVREILDSYHGSTPVTPEMAHGFQQQFQTVSPNLAHLHTEWSSSEKTQRFLSELLGARDQPSRKLPSPEETPKQSTRRQVRSDFLDEYEQSLAPEGDYSGTVIVYSSTKLYGKDQEDDESDADPQDAMGPPAPPPKDWRYSPLPRPPVETHASSGVITPFDTDSRLSSPFQSALPEKPARDGLGLSFESRSANGNKSRNSSTSRSPEKVHSSSAGGNKEAVGGMASPASTSARGRRLVSGSPTVGQADSDYTRSISTDRTSESGGSVLTQRISSRAPGKKSIDTTSETLEELDPKVEQSLRRRRYVVKELIDTELHYFQDMKVVEDIYKGTSFAIHEVTDEDRRILFGNTAELVEFSLQFLDSLRPAAEGIYKLNHHGRWAEKEKERQSVGTDNSIATGGSADINDDPVSVSSDRQTRIGAVFMEHLTDMERVYSVYVQNHGAANTRLMKMQENKQVNIWLGECHKYAADITSAWDLDALIVKPTQRFLKYAMLLDSILKVTPPDHPDYQNLKAASDGMRSMSARINETKGRKEIVEKIVTRKREKSDGGSMAFSLKAFGRRTEKIKQQVGLAEAVDDPEYDAISQKFGGHFFQLQIVMRDVEKYLEDLQKLVDQNNVVASELEGWLDISFPLHVEIESKWRQYVMAIREITAHGLIAHRDEVRKSVIKPIQILWELHGKPQKLMQKRKKRLPEYAKFKVAKENGTTVEKKLKEVADEFVAINGALKDELPLLYAKTKVLIENCQRNLIDSQRRWYQVFATKLGQILAIGDDVEKHSHDNSELESIFNRDYRRVQEELERIEGVMRSLRELATFSPATTFMTDSDFSIKRPSTFSSSRRTQSIASDQSIVVGSPEAGQSKRTSGNYNHIPDFGTPLLSEPNQASPTSTTPGRIRTGSTMSSRDHSAPHSFALPTVTSAGHFSPRPSTSSGRNADTLNTGFGPRLSSENADQGRTSGQSSFSTQTAVSQHTRTSSIFSSAMPMSDFPHDPRDDTDTEVGPKSDKVLFLAASLFEFNIAHDRREAGFPYLVYVPGEVFDVLAMRGELWLARNQDDPNRTVGWIWEKHFATLSEQ